MAVCPLSGGEWFCPNGTPFHGTTYCHLPRCISVRNGAQMGEHSDLVMWSIYLPPSIDTKLRQLSAETGRTKSALIVEFIEDGLAPRESPNIERIVQAMLDDIGNANKLDMTDPHRRVITVQLSSADLIGMAQAALSAAGIKEPRDDDIRES
jgi:hypothetical protein